MAGRSKYKKALGEVVEFYEGKLHSLLKWVEKKEGGGDCRQLDPADDTLALNVVRDYWSKYFCQKPSRFEEHRYNALRYSLGSTIVQYNKDFFCGYHAKGIMASDKTDDVLGKLYEAINAPENILVEHESED
ncbi:Protein of unknown function [Pyronema omphalodes CBS 100304]|uniref:Uncharacterized protein n=1 Tax=Pyronema omphalodes (strain CBS 100304) TaxID=1076935 RepID=U4KZJ8_PYROM|nr:Protein of unknown function [Pyronema omphalodes CBS 100304]